MRLGAKPPSDLQAPGREVWADVVREHDIADAARLAILKQVCVSLDRAEQCAQQIRVDGVMIEGKGGVRDNPLLRHELQHRALAARLLQRLIASLPKRPPGRPPVGGLGISHADAVKYGLITE